jgi:hypothetical protein
MYLPKVVSRKTSKKILIGALKVNDENSRIRTGYLPKCHGSAFPNTAILLYYYRTLVIADLLMSKVVW